MLRALSLLGQVDHDALFSNGLRTPDSGARSPYFTPPPTGPVTRSKSARPPSRSELKRLAQLQGSESPIVIRKHALPPTPASPTPKAKKRGRPPGSKKAIKKAKKVKNEHGHDPLTCDDTMNAVIAPDENGNVHSIGKIHLIQERVRHDPWKMLIATCLLNVTSGRAARPIFVELTRRWPTPQALAQASIPDLTDLLYPLGLFNQRASSLVRFSQQYISLDWPIHPGTASSDAHVHPTTAVVHASVPDNLDVTVFAGAGRYASDSFRIYSDLYPGRGAPERESRWLDKRARAMDRIRAARKGTEGESDPAEQGVEVEGLSGYLSDEEDVGEEEWRTVRPLDKELRRYLIWRWGLEGIVYDIHKGPQITLERDRKRLRQMCDLEAEA